LLPFAADATLMPLPDIFTPLAAFFAFDISLLLPPYADAACRRH